MRASNTPQIMVPLTKAVKILLILNLGIWFLLQVIMEGYMGVPFLRYFGLFPGQVIESGAVWQLFTYMFLHSMSVSHIVFNLLMLWFIGSELEAKWGTRFFVTYYLLSGAGAGVLYCLGIFIYAMVTGVHYAFNVPVIGASGGIFGLLLAYGIIFGERIINFMMIFPMKAKVFVLILGAIEVLSLVSAGVAGGDVANLAHLGGIASGFMIIQGWNGYLQYQWRRKAKKRTNTNLKLVVNNEENPPRNPKFWN